MNQKLDFGLIDLNYVECVVIDIFQKFWYCTQVSFTTSIWFVELLDDQYELLDMTYMWSGDIILTCYVMS